MRRLALLIFSVSLAIPGVAKSQQSSRALDFQFEGNSVFSDRDLLETTNQCLQRFKPSTSSESDAIDYCLTMLKFFMFEKGYLRATVGPPRIETGSAVIKVVVPIEEGLLHRLGQVTVEGSSLFTPTQILKMLTLKTGDIADAKALSDWANKIVKKAYAEHGHLQYTAEIDPNYSVASNGQEGVADIRVTIDEGPAFTVRSIIFDGRGEISNASLLRQMSIRVGETFHQDLFEDSLKRVGEDGPFENIDPVKDVDFRTEPNNPILDLVIHLKKKTS